MEMAARILATLRLFKMNGGIEDERVSKEIEELIYE